MRLLILPFLLSLVTAVKPSQPEKPEQFSRKDVAFSFGDWRGFDNHNRKGLRAPFSTRVPTHFAPSPFRRRLQKKKKEKPEEPEQLTLDDIAVLWLTNKGKKSKCAEAVAIAWTESKGKVAKKGYNMPGTVDRGLWQINDRKFPKVSDACAFHPNCNAKAAIKISKNGKDWSAWKSAQPPQSYHTGYMSAAQVACSRSKGVPADDQLPDYYTTDEEDSNRPFLSIFGSTREEVDHSNSRFHVANSFDDWLGFDNSEKKGSRAPITTQVPTHFALSPFGRRLKRDKHLTMEEIARAWKAAGGRDCGHAVAIAWAISGGNERWNKGGRVGIWGLVLNDHYGLTRGCATDLTCVVYAVVEHSRYGSNWAVFPEFTKELHKGHLPAAKTAC